jgi:hypothetical protein
MRNEAVRAVTPYLLPNAAAVAYTYTGNKYGVALIGFLSLCNIDVAARTVNLAIVPAGGTITSTTYRVINALTLQPNQTVFLVSDSEDTALGNALLRDGDQIVLWASAATAIATRLTMVEYNQG